MNFGIAGRWALVCGASRGLGLACATALAHEGAHVVMVARGREALDEAARLLRGAPDLPPQTQVQTVAADIATAAGRAEVFALRRDFDIVVTNAGGPPPGDFRDWDRDTWLRTLDANMLAPIELMKATVDGMAARGFGRVVNITSSAVKAPIEILGLSNGARSGLTGFVAGLARSHTLARANVTINNLLPGGFETGRFKATVEKAGRNYEDEVAQRVRAIPAGRFGTPAEFGAYCAFLCSAQAAYITGQNLLADGGAYPGTL